MKLRRLLSLMALGAFLCAPLTAAAADGPLSVYVFSQDGNDFSIYQAEGPITFWEAPDVTTGQTRSGGEIVLKNQSTMAADFTLTGVGLPYGNTEALTYLDAVTLHLSDGERELYNGPFTRLSEGEAIRVTNVAPGEERHLAVSVSCAFSYKGNVPSYTSMVWTFTPELSDPAASATTPYTTGYDPLHPKKTVNWLLLAEIAGALVLATGGAGLCVWAYRKCKKK